MHPIEICYTPLDVPTRPDVDIAKFLSWTKSTYPQPFKSLANTAENLIGKDYPWDLVWGAYDGVWQNNFDKEFPELSVYCYEAFKIHPHELSGAIFLPVRKSVQGVSFWHNDVDPTGFRFYIECEHYNDNPLLLRKTKLPYSQRISIAVPLTGEDSRLQKKVFHCKMTDPHMAYYLNNVRAAHAVSVNIPGIRIAAFITVKKMFTEIVQNRTRDLIVSSALKYNDHAILW